MSEKEKEFIISLLLAFFLFFCYLATLPKHADFESLIYPGKVFASGVNDLSQYLLENGKTINFAGSPLLGILFGIWIKVGLLFLSVNLETWTFGSLPKVMQYWCMIPYLLMLLLLTSVSFIQLKNKWLTFICFGTFSFFSIIIMGQIDVWNTFWIYIAILLALKAIETENNLKFIFLSIFTLGLSMQFKLFGGLILPVFLFFFWLSLQNKQLTMVKQYCILLGLVLEFIIVSFWEWGIWPQHLFSGGLLVESSWLLNLQLAPVNIVLPYHIISVWLLGYIIILYDMIRRSEYSTKLQVKKLFIFYIFSTIVWLFVSAYTYPQWWFLLIPTFLLVLDNFSYKFNYLFYVCISELFLIYSMQFKGNIDEIMKLYMPIIPVTGNFSVIIVTLISAIFLLWIYELRQETTQNPEESPRENRTDTFLSISKIAPILPVVLIVFLFLVVSLILP